MSGGDPQTGDRGAANERSALLAEAHVTRQVARLFSLDGGGTEDGADGADVGDDVVALGFVAFDLVRRLG